MSFRPSLLHALFTFFILTVMATAVHAADITPVEAQRLLKASPPAFLLDVRSSGEYLQKRIADAKLIPIDQLQGREAEIPRDRPVIVYCETGVRSSHVTNYLLRLGYRQVYNLTGGIMSWQVRGYPVLTGRP